MKHFFCDYYITLILISQWFIYIKLILSILALLHLKKPQNKNSNQRFFHRIMYSMKKILWYGRGRNLFVPTDSLNPLDINNFLLEESMKRKFSLFVTIAVCLLIAVGILSACNDPGEQDPGVHVHSMELTAAKEATCTEGGNNAYYHCSGCNRCFKDEAGTQETTVEAETIAATGHKWNNGEVTTAATCTEDGVMTFTCSNCNKTRTETIPATGHNWNDGELE